MCDRVEHLRAEQRERWRKGDRVPAEEYLARHSSVRADPERTLEVIYQEILLREELGEAPQSQEYQRRFPQIANRLPALFEVHGLLGPNEPLVPDTRPALEADAAGVATVAYPDGFWASPAPTPPPTSLPCIPGYELLEQLGKGGMGVVYKARHSGLDRLVAIKVLPQRWCRDSAFIERFGREARVLARLNHPNIVAIHDVGRADGRYYLVMEYVDGIDLRRAMTAGRVSPNALLGLVTQLCRGLQHAHGLGVVHRDIKPENILLDRHGQIKIADFGLAKLLGPQPTSLTGSQQIMGTRHYMAPEQVFRAREVDHRADLYSLGVTFYELLTGELPAEKFRPPSRCAAVNPLFDSILMRTLEKDPTRRYQSAAELEAAIVAVGQSPFREGPKSGASFRWTKVLVLVVLVLLLMGCTGLLREFSSTGPALWLGLGLLLMWPLAKLGAGLAWLIRSRDE